MFTKIIVAIMLLGFFVPVDSRRIPVQILAIICQWAWYIGMVILVVWMVKKML